MHASLRVRFNREVDIEDGYLSPGGYEVVIKGGKHIRFDFTDSCAGYAGDDHSVIDYYMEGLDGTYYPECHKELMDNFGKIISLEECYIDTESQVGVDPISIESFTLSHDGKSFDLPKEMLRKAKMY